MNELFDKSSDLNIEDISVPQTTTVRQSTISRQGTKACPLRCTYDKRVRTVSSCGIVPPILLFEKLASCKADKEVSPDKLPLRKLLATLKEVSEERPNNDDGSVPLNPLPDKSNDLQTSIVRAL